MINIGLGRAHNSPNQFTGKAVNTLEDKGGEINMTFDGGMWSHNNMGGLEAFQIDGKNCAAASITSKARLHVKALAVFLKILAATFISITWMSTSMSSTT